MGMNQVTFVIITYFLTSFLPVVDSFEISPASYSFLFF